MAIVKIGKSHHARKELFQRGIRQGYLSVRDIEEALPPGAMTDAERWLLYYSLRAAQVEIRDEAGQVAGAPPLSDAQRAELEAKRSGAAGDAGSREAEEPADTEAGPHPEH